MNYSNTPVKLEESGDHGNNASRLSNTPVALDHAELTTPVACTNDSFVASNISIISTPATSSPVVLKQEDSTETIAEKEINSDLSKIILSCCVGTLIEWYDFFVFGSMAGITGFPTKFYKTGTPDGDTIAWLATYAVGFLFRPFGSVVFGYIGDKIGRKFTFLTCLLLMGGCTFLVGCMPTNAEIGPAAGYILILLRILQGLAIGGEYGGAAIYIAEHAPHNRRGYYTSFIQTTATLGLCLSLGVLLAIRGPMEPSKFLLWGWRLPFLISIFLVAAAVYIRFQLEESPLYTEAKAQGRTRGNPLYDSFFKPYNLYYVCLSLFGATMGQGVVWYTAQFTSLTFLTGTLKLQFIDAYCAVGAALLLGAPLFVLVGHLSDSHGRKPFMVAGLFLGCALFYPIFMGLYHYGRYVDPTVAKESLVFNDAYSPIMLSFLVFIMVTFVALVYGPIAAFLVELFPTSIRYTSMSLPYHIGNGVFGGLVPVLGNIIALQTKMTFAILWFPLGCAVISLVIMVIFVPETYNNNIETMGLEGKHHKGEMLNAEEEKEI